MVRQVREHGTSDGKRFKVRYRLGTTETFDTFRRRPDAEMFRDILGDGTGDRVTQAVKWLRARQDEESTATVTFGTWFPRYVDP